MLKIIRKHNAEKNARIETSLKDLENYKIQLARLKAEVSVQKNQYNKATKIESEATQKLRDIFTAYGLDFSSSNFHMLSDEDIRSAAELLKVIQNSKTSFVVIEEKIRQIIANENNMKIACTALAKEIKAQVSTMQGGFLLFSERALYLERLQQIMQDTHLFDIVTTSDSPATSINFSETNEECFYELFEQEADDKNKHWRSILAEEERNRADYLKEREEVQFPYEGDEDEELAVIEESRITKTLTKERSSTPTHTFGLQPLSNSAETVGLYSQGCSSTIFRRPQEDALTAIRAYTPAVNNPL